MACSAYFEGNMVFNINYLLSLCQSCTRTEMSFKATVISFGRGKTGSVAHRIDLICVTPSLLYGIDILFESVLTFSQLLVGFYG